MSLNVYLNLPGAQTTHETRIYIREDGQTKAISRTEWDARFPDREPAIVESGGDGQVYSANITHNLGRMAQAAGIYEVLWRPEEVSITLAEQLIQPLRDGLALLNSDPARFEMLNPENGWGNYEGLCRFVADYLAACEHYPQAEVSVWR